MIKTKTKRSELGDFLRSRRERLDPAEVGLPALRRRTPGLRREEVAMLAGIGADWHTRLEQGRSTTPSVSTVDALARALQLGETDRSHLQTLAQVARPRPFERERVPEPIQRVVDSLQQPAYITGRWWDVLAWNRAADQLLGFSQLPLEDRNILIAVVLLPGSRSLFGENWESEARRVVAQFRITHDLWAEDPAFVSLLARLHAEPEFSRWWKAHDVRAPLCGHQGAAPPDDGHTSLRIHELPGQRRPGHEVGRLHADMSPATRPTAPHTVLSSCRA